MPLTMTLEGPQLREARLRTIRGQLARPVTVHNFMAKMSTLDGILDPVFTYKGIAIVSLLAGMWLAGTARGQSLTRKIRRK